VSPKNLLPCSLHSTLVGPTATTISQTSTAQWMLKCIFPIDYKCRNKGGERLANRLISWINTTYCVCAFSMYNSHAITDNLNLAYPNTSCLRRISSDQSIHNNRGVACWVGRRFAVSDRAASSHRLYRRRSSSFEPVSLSVIVCMSLFLSSPSGVFYKGCSPTRCFPAAQVTGLDVVLVGAAVLVFSLEPWRLDCVSGSLTGRCSR
jgi:hypothetical protein